MCGCFQIVRRFLAPIEDVIEVELMKGLGGKYFYDQFYNNYSITDIFDHTLSVPVLY